MEKKGIGTRLYSDAAEFGLVTSKIGAYIGTVIGIGMICGGIYMLTKKSDSTNPELMKSPKEFQENTKNIQKDFNKNVGIGLIVFGLLFIIGGWLNYYFSKKSKFLAAANALNIFRN
jgi:hypothetical protein